MKIRAIGVLQLRIAGDIAGAATAPILYTAIGRRDAIIELSTCGSTVLPYDAVLDVAFTRCKSATVVVG